MLNIVLNATAQRKPDQAAPEIVLDPLDSVGGQFSLFGCLLLPVFSTGTFPVGSVGEKKRPFNSNFCQALRQLSSVPSSQLCVRLAAGGDPTYAFNVRFQGEEVHGTSECTSVLLLLSLPSFLTALFPPPLPSLLLRSSCLPMLRIHSQVVRSVTSCGKQRVSSRALCSASLCPVPALPLTTTEANTS